MGHDLATESIEDLAFVVDPIALRYRVPSAALSARWKVDDRYRRTGFISRADARAFVLQTMSIVSKISAALWLDGRVQEGML